MEDTCVLAPREALRTAARTVTLNAMKLEQPAPRRVAGSFAVAQDPLTKPAKTYL